MHDSFWFYRVFLGKRGAFHWTSCDMCREGNSCGLVAAETRWEHVLCVCSGNDITHSMTSTWQQWKEREMRGRTRLCFVFDWSTFSQKNLWGKIMKGKPWCSQKCPFFHHNANMIVLYLLVPVIHIYINTTLRFTWLCTSAITVSSFLCTVIDA